MKQVYAECVGTMWIGDSVDEEQESYLNERLQY